MTLPQYARRECSVDGVAVRLSPMACELFTVLLAASPDRPLDRDTLIETLWPNPDLQPLTADKVIQTLVARLRGLGIPIGNQWGRGYFIGEAARGGPRAAAPTDDQPQLAAAKAVKQCGRSARRTLPPDAQVICGQIRREIVRIGWSEAGRQSGIDRTVLHRAFPRRPVRHPSFETIANVANALGFELALQRRSR